MRILKMCKAAEEEGLGLDAITDQASHTAAVVTVPPSMMLPICLALFLMLLTCALLGPTWQCCALAACRPTSQAIPCRTGMLAGGLAC